MSATVLSRNLLEQESGLSYDCCKEYSACCGDNSFMQGSAYGEINAAVAARELAAVSVVEMNGDCEVSRFIGEGVISRGAHNILTAAHRAEGFSRTGSSNRPDGDFLLINQELQVELTANTANVVPARLDGAEWVDDRDLLVAVEQSWSKDSGVEQNEGKQGPENHCDLSSCCAAVEDSVHGTKNQNEVGTGYAKDASRSESFFGSAAHMSIVPQDSDSKGAIRG